MFRWAGGVLAPLVVLCFGGMLPTPALAASDAELCSAAKAAMGNDFVVDCPGHTITTESHTPLYQGDNAHASHPQLAVNAAYCKDAIWRLYAAAGWTLQLTQIDANGAKQTYTAHCASAPAPLAEAAPTDSVSAADVTSQIAPRFSDAAGKSAAAPELAPTIWGTEGAPRPGKPLAMLPTAKIDTQPLVTGNSGKAFEIYEATSQRADCRAGSPAEINVDKPPQHGTISVVRQLLVAGYPRGSTLSHCNGRSVMGVVITYRSDDHYVGPDSVQFQADFEGGGEAEITVPIKVQ